MDVIFNIMQLEMSCVTFMSTQQDLFIKHVKWVGSGQSALLTSQVRVEGSWHIIKGVGFVLSHLVKYPYLDTTWTWHTNPNWNPYPQVKKGMQIYIHTYIYIYKSRDFMWESMRFCQVNILCKENSNILNWHIKDKDKLNIDFLFHLV